MNPLVGQIYFLVAPVLIAVIALVALRRTSQYNARLDAELQRSAESRGTIQEQMNEIAEAVARGVRQSPLSEA